MLLSGQFLGCVRIENAAARRQADFICVSLGANGVQTVKNGLSAHKHARSASKRVVVGILMLAAGIIPYVYYFKLYKPVLGGPAQDAVL
jgi:hypothetical protein